MSRVERDAEKWEEQLRPIRYEDVRGQPTAVRLLSGLARRRVGRSLLLAGPVGSGKTSLARLHARAMNCDAQNEHGSACERCERCRLSLSDVMKEINAASQEGDPHNVAIVLKEWNRTPTHCAFRIVFFDEAHNLPADSQERLLKAVENPPPGVVFIFATTEPLRLRRALRSRVMPVRIEMFSTSDALELLQEVATIKGLAIDHEALCLIAAAKPYPRDMIISLQQLSEYGCHVGIALVKDVLDLSVCDHLERYMLKLAKGDAAGQVEAMDDWRDDYSTKSRWVRLFLLTAYYNEVLNQRVVPDALCYGLHQARINFVQDVAAQLSLSDRKALKSLFEDMLRLWHQHGDRDETQRRLTFALLESICSGAKRSRDSDQPNLLVHFLTDEPLRLVNGEWTADDQLPTIRDEGFMTHQEVREIMNRASFLRQHCGKLFNFSIRIEVSASLDRTEARAVAELQSAGRALLDALSVGSEAGGIISIENDSGTIVGRLVAWHAIDEDQLGAVVAKWAGDNEGAGMVAGQWRHENDSAEFHWRAVRDLCAGYCEGLGESHSKTLREHLKIPKREWRAPAPLDGARLVFVGALRSGTIVSACAHHMGLLYAFDAEAWTYLYTDWEEKEHIDRLEEVALRRGQLETLARRLGVETEEYAHESTTLLERWKLIRAEFRARRWNGWW